MKKPLCAALALLVMVLAGCGGGAAANNEHILRWGTTTIPTTMDPTLAGSDAHIVYFTAVYESLVLAEPDGTLSGGLATDWSLSEDGLTFEMTLREGVTFQDGEPFNAAAVTANIAYAQRDGSILAPQLSGINSVEEVDETHVRMHLNRPGGDLPEIFRGYAGMMASPKAIEAGTLGIDPVGAGPFTVGAVSDSQVTYDRWADYWDADSVELDGLEVQILTDDNARLSALKSGQLDATFVRPNQVKEAEAAGLKTTTGPRVFVYGLFLNPGKSQFADPAVRKAVSLAIDRESIDDYLYDGGCTPSAQIYPKEYWAYSDEVNDDEYIDYDQQAAAAAFAEAGELTFTLTTSNLTNYQELSATIQDQMKKVGINVTVQAIDSNESSAKLRSGDYEAMVTAMYSANPDPADYALQNYKAAGSGEYVSPLVPELANQSLLTVDHGARAKAMGELSNAVLEAGTPLIPICIPDMVFAFSESVQGMEVPLLGNYDFRHVSMD